MKVTIPVKKKHIMECNMSSRDKCVMALAISDALPLASRVEVGYTQCRLYDMNDQENGFALPVEVSRFIWNMAGFTMGARALVAERSFEIDVPDQFVAKEPERPVQEEVPTPQPQSSPTEPKPVESVG